VYAYKSEVDLWWSERRRGLEQEEDRDESPETRRIPAGLRTIVAILLAAAFSYFVLVGRPSEGRLMLAVLPFENLSGQPDEEYFSDGMTEDLTTELSRLDPEELGIIARSSAMHYKGTRKRADVIARELGVDYLLEGSVRREGARVRIAAQLVRASDQTQRWAETYDRDLKEILSVQREVARAVAGEIHSRLAETHPVTSRAQVAVGPEAYEAYLRGRYLADRRTGASVLEARRWFERAIALAPDYARAQVGLADTHLLAVTYADAPTDASIASARAAVRKALSLDETLPDAHAWLGVILTEHDWDWAAAEREYRRAIELDANYAYAHKLYAEFLTYMGRFEEGLSEARIATELDPRSVVTHSMLGIALYTARRYPEAISVLRETISLDPAHPLPYLPLGLAHAQRGEYEEAREALEKAGALSPESSEILGQLAYVHGKAGNTERSAELLEELRRRSESQYVSPFYFAVAHTGLGEWSRALDWLEKGYDERIWLMCVVNTDPLFDPLRREPRFQALLRRMNFRE
jgi:TolB-like protein/Flp pilus assembly protein TadD